MHRHMIRWAITVILAGCGLSQPPPQTPTTGDPDRKALTQEECGAQGGSVVGDIGDGATQIADGGNPGGSWHMWILTLMLTAP